MRKLINMAGDKELCAKLDDAAFSLSQRAQNFQSKTCLLRVNGLAMLDPDYVGGSQPGDETVSPRDLLITLTRLQDALSTLSLSLYDLLIEAWPEDD